MVSVILQDLRDWRTHGRCGGRMPSTIRSLWSTCGGFAAARGPQKGISGGGCAAPKPPPPNSCYFTRLIERLRCDHAQWYFIFSSVCGFSARRGKTAHTKIGTYHAAVGSKAFAGGIA